MKKPSRSSSDDTPASPGTRPPDCFDRTSDDDDEPGTGTRPPTGSASDASSVGSYQLEEAVEYEAMVDLTREDVCRVLMACREKQADGSSKRVVVVCGQPLRTCRRSRHQVKSLSSRNRGPPRFYMPYYSGKGSEADGLFHGPTCTESEMGEYRKMNAAELGAVGAALAAPMEETEDGSEESQRSGELSDSEASMHAHNSVQRMGRQLLAEMEDSRREALATPGPPQGRGSWRKEIAPTQKTVVLAGMDHGLTAAPHTSTRGSNTPRTRNPTGAPVGEWQSESHPESVNS